MVIIVTEGVIWFAKAVHYTTHYCKKYWIYSNLLLSHAWLPTMAFCVFVTDVIFLWDLYHPPSLIHLSVHIKQTTSHSYISMGGRCLPWHPQGLPLQCGLDSSAATLNINVVVLSVCLTVELKSHLQLRPWLFPSSMQYKPTARCCKDDIIVTIIICTHMSHTHKQIHTSFLYSSSCSLTHHLLIIHMKIHYIQVVGYHIRSAHTQQEAHIWATFSTMMGFSDP